MRPLATLLLASMLGASLIAQESGERTKASVPDGTGSVAFRQALLDASTDAVVLNLAAHPDDESARTMVLLRNRFGVRTVTGYATCGEGGQNAIGREIGPALAAIRARETLAAAARYGTKVHWLGFPDFGFSKSLPETLQVWGEAETEARFRALLDEVQPDLVITNHTIDRGHGHHRAVAWAAQKLCAEKGIPLFERYAAQWDGDDREADKKNVPGVFRFDVGAVDPLRGATFARQAHEAWTLHRSQGPWRDHDPTRVREDRWFQRVPEVEKGTRAPLAWVPSTFANLRLASFSIPEQLPIGAVEQGFARLGELSVDELDRLCRDTESVVAFFRRTEGAAWFAERLERRLDALERAVAYGRGVALETFLRDDELAWSGARQLRVRVLGAESALTALRVDGETAWERGATDGDEAVDDDGFVAIDLRLPKEVRDDEVVDLTRVYRFFVEADVRFGDRAITLERQLPVRVAPDSEVRWSREAAYVPVESGWKRAYSVEVVWRGDGELDERVRFQAPESIEVEAIPARVSLSPERRTARVTVRIRRKDDEAARAEPFQIVARVGAAGSSSLYVQPLPVPSVDERPIALIRGPEDTTERFLGDLGIRFESLDETALAVAEFDRYRTILLDIRAYQHRPELADHAERLMAYVRGGGRVVSMYHKPREWNAGPGRPALVPFELKTTNSRISEEDAELKILDPEHPLFTTPFRIGAGDFDGWVQERGLNFPTERDSAWVPLLVGNDEGEDPLDGALLYARYGRGDYVYCSLALYRQLRLGHVGSARILLNLIDGAAND